MKKPGKEEEEDPVVKYQMENRKLHQVSLRLEQENDNLAHRLITGKIDLRNALDKAEDRVDELTADLLNTRRQLQATEEEKKRKEEETAMLKEVMRRELEKAELEVKRSSGIIADYKQICSQLTNRLEKQQAAHREEKDAFKTAVMACTRCRRVIESEIKMDYSCGSSPTEGDGGSRLRLQEDGGTEVEKRIGEREALTPRVREVEQELAQTKLQMVEAKCRIQDLEHQKGILVNDLQEAKNTWFSKAFTSLRTSSGGIHSMNIHRDEAPATGWNFHGHPLPGRNGKKLLWPHRDNRENV
ncbi:rab GTPase-activating protein 1-like isoform X2 [Genypterus blacodes]